MFSAIKRLSQDHWPVFLLSNISSVMNLVLPLILVRLLAPSDMGLYKTFFLYVSLIPFLTMAGGPVNSIYFWIGKKEDEKRAYIKASWTATTLLSSLIIFPGLIAVYFFHHHFGLTQSSLLMLIIAGFISCPAGHFSEVCIAKGENFLGAGLSTAFEFVKIVGFIFIAWKYRDINLLFTYYFVIMIASLIFMTYLGYRDQSLDFSFDKMRVQEILKYSLPISLSAFFIFIIDKADQLIISAMATPSTFAYYSFGCLVIPPLYLLESSVQKNLIPKLATSFTERKYSEMASHYQKAIADIAYLIVPAIFGLFFFADPIVELLYTKTYLPSVVFLQVFALSYILLLIPHDSVLRASGETKSIMRIYFWLTPFSILLIYLAAKFLDLKYVLAISIVIKLLPKIYCFKLSANIMKVPALALIPFKKLAEFCALSAFLTILCMLAKNLFATPLQWFIVSAPLFAVCYLGFFIFRHMKNSP